ncbi:MAG: LCP family protein [Clostridia bacterium]|nr:LCP family protein [Clostridia bacterium]
MKSMKSSTFKLLAALFASAAILALVFIGMRLIEKYAVRKADADIDTTYSSIDMDQTIYIDGQAYVPKDGVETLLLIGLDSQGKLNSSAAYTNSQMADFLALFVFDDGFETCQVIQLNRDTMAEIPVLGMTGERTGYINAQLAMAYSYGDGLTQSCRNTVNAVSHFLYDIEIDHYLALNMDAVSKLNDLVGGVQVEVLDDFTGVDDTLVKGETVTLKGAHALNYVRGRTNVGDGTNLARMARQRQYMEAFGAALRAAYAKGKDEFVLKAYGAVADHMVTDCSVNALSETAEKVSSYKIAGVISPTGKNVQGDPYMEFYADADALKTTVVSLFYAPAIHP